MTVVWATCATTDRDHTLPAECTLAVVLSDTAAELWWPCPDCGVGHVTDLSRTALGLIRAGGVPVVDLSAFDPDAELQELTP